METIGSSIDSLLVKYGLKEQLEAREHLSIWEKIVGVKIAQYTRPLTIHKKKLIVEVNDSNWLYHLTMLKDKIIREFNMKACSTIITEIRFLNADFTSRDIFDRK
ncbi:MAG: DciA family protein [Dethiobacteria bacterium]|jgi:predicted nucleic acid-binding Zn ribbon protein